MVRAPKYLSGLERGGNAVVWSRFRRPVASSPPADPYGCVLEYCLEIGGSGDDCIPTPALSTSG